MAKKNSNLELIADNKKAKRNYDVVQTYEAGLVLLGSEVKSLRLKRVNLSDSYAHFKGMELYLKNCHISPYTHAGYNNHDPLRERKLLLHKRELKRLYGKLKERGFTLIPLDLYFSEKGLVKVTLGLCKGKALYDRRKEIKAKDIKRDMERDFKSRW